MPTTGPVVDPAALPLERKVSLLSGRDFWSTAPLADAGIPSLVLTDGPHGIRRQDVAAADHLGFHASWPSTCFPPAVAVASSWDPEVAARVGAAIGREARALGVHVVLGPGLNIKRSPLCGRNFEYYSEDPLLSGVLGAAHVRGLQAQGVGVSVKHFAVHNQETDRMRVSAEVDERTLREIYLPAFERVVTEARPVMVMTAYNRVNGVPMSQHHRLLADVLRGEWGFEGVVVSDWGGVYDRVAALVAGLDLQMPGPSDANDAKVEQAVRDGKLAEAVVDTGVRRVAALARSLATSDAVAGTAGIPEEEHHALARELAAEGVVLLKNGADVLPLRVNSRIAVIGEVAARPLYQGGGSSRINATRADSALEAMRDVGESVRHARGFTTDDACGDGDDVSVELLGEAVGIAADSDVAVVFVAGNGDTEGRDRETLDLPAEQIELIRAVAAAAPRTVVVVSGGGVVSLEGWHDDVDAIVEGWLLGQGGGHAISDVLFGVVNPSGHLAETIPLRLQDTPAYTNFPGEAGHVRYGEGVMVGYRHYGTVERAVRYPFGHGLSYTTFATTGMTVEATGDDTATARVTVTNTGDRAGRHVVQAYVATTAGPVRRPARELRAFAKVSLAPGETRVVELALERRAFAYYDVENSRWTVAAGEYRIQIGESAARIVAERSVTLPGDASTKELSLDSSFGEWLGHPVLGPLLRETMAAGMSEERRRASELNSDMIHHVVSVPVRQLLNFPGIELAEQDLVRMLESTR
ncbi:glycoside hydrolase family 3 C-terminal domain-containing protein [Streptomyces sp. NPDC090088]|uniref:glycoside hydrolase family 3 C-terminal domain-containing protein n=1 Tax=Streptomyces sp. NPDC090088 TaxID=3365944 RepID=UPI003829AB4C